MDAMIGQPTSTATKWIVGGGLALIIGLIAVVFVRQEIQRRAWPELPVISSVADFQLTNQLGAAVTLANLRGKVWLANVIFTRCPGPCLAMSRQLAVLQKQLPSNDRVRVVTLTIDPEFDTPAVLKRYAEKLGADPARWWFLTGASRELRRLAIDDLKFVAVDKDAKEQQTPDDLFIHSTYFMAVDRHGRLRAVIESTEPGANEKAVATVNQLLAEP